MTINVLTAMPPAPSRVGDPANFGVESLNFLAAQPQFVTQANQARDYLNALLVDPYNWGIVSSAPPAREQVAAFPAPPIESDSGFEFASEGDATLAALQAFIADANAAGVYIDALATASAATVFVTDTLRPTVPMVQPSQLQSDPQTTFDTKAFTFYASLGPYGAGYGGMADYVYVRLVEPEDFGLAADAVTETDDYGVLA